MPARGFSPVMAIMEHWSWSASKRPLLDKGLSKMRAWGLVTRVVPVTYVALKNPKVVDLHPKHFKRFPHQLACGQIGGSWAAGSHTDRQTPRELRVGGRHEGSVGLGDKRKCCVWHLGELFFLMFLFGSFVGWPLHWCCYNLFINPFQHCI